MSTSENNKEGELVVKESRDDDAYARNSFRFHRNQRNALIFEF